MYCKKCGSTLQKEDRYCKECGTKLLETDYNNVQRFSSSETDDFDKRLIKAYIGNNADSLYDSILCYGSNVPSLLFGFFYYMYRKIYLISFIMIIIFTIVIYFFSTTALFLEPFVRFAFLPIYKYDITRKLRKIKRNNPNATEEQILELAKRKGGVSLFSAIISFVIFLIYIMYM